MYLVYFEHYEYEWNMWDACYDPYINLADAVKQAKALKAKPNPELRKITVLDAKEISNWEAY